MRGNMNSKLALNGHCEIKNCGLQGLDLTIIPNVRNITITIPSVASPPRARTHARSADLGCPRAPRWTRQAAQWRGGGCGRGRAAAL